MATMTTAKNTLPDYLPAEYAEVLAVEDAAALSDLADAMGREVFGRENRDVTRADCALALLDFLAKVRGLRAAASRLADILGPGGYDEPLDAPLADVLDERSGDDLAPLVLPALIWNLEHAEQFVECGLQGDLAATLRRIAR